MREIIFDLLCVGKPAKAFSLNPEVHMYQPIMIKQSKIEPKKIQRLPVELIFLLQCCVMHYWLLFGCGLCRE